MAASQLIPRRELSPVLLRAAAFSCLCLLVVNPAKVFAQAPLVFEGGVVNGASFRPSDAPRGAVAQGSIISIFGSNLASATGNADSVPLPIQIIATRVTIGGRAAPLFFVSAGQINAQLPWNTPTGTVQLTVKTPQGISTPVNVSVVETAPGLFSQVANGRGPGAVLNFVSQENTPTNTAASTITPNGIVLIFATGLGAGNGNSRRRSRWRRPTHDHSSGGDDWRAAGDGGVLRSGPGLCGLVPDQRPSASRHPRRLLSAGAGSVRRRN